MFKFFWCSKTEKDYYPNISEELTPRVSDLDPQGSAYFRAKGSGSAKKWGSGSLDSKNAEKMENLPKFILNLGHSLMRANL